MYRELGDQFVERLVGAFALAVWDARAHRLLLARDRAGERPLFYHLSGEGDERTVRFATEIAALTRDGTAALTRDSEAIFHYLRYGCFAAPLTPFREIRKVAPAQVVSFDPKTVETRRYWRWSAPESEKRAPSVEAFDQTFRQAVLRQSEIDVEYGVFLSGGIDSSLVAAVARSVRSGFRPRAYTLRFEDPSYDEGNFAGEVAGLLGCEQVTVWVKPESLPSEIAGLVRMVGEPLADPAWVPTALLSRRAAQDVKLALCGEGADELFGGYPTYLGAQWADRFNRLPPLLRSALRSVINRWPPSDKKVTLSFLLKRFVAAAEQEGMARHRLWTSNLPPALLRRLGLPDAAPDPETDSAGLLLDRVQRCDLETSLAEGLLTKADRASMGSALELRAPFLDRAVMEFAATLPVDERVRGITTKVFLKRYAHRYLPGKIVERKKRGLSVPLSRWLRGPLRDWAGSRLLDDRLARAGVDPNGVRALLDEHTRRQADHARALWTLITLDEWLRWCEEIG
jgi:asparagine synthase (glutamine-hydrolysing)